MGKSTMSPKIPVMDTEPKPEHINVGQHGTDRANHPDPLPYLRARKYGSDT
jgi:hypothetical protein